MMDWYIQIWTKSKERKLEIAREELVRRTLTLDWTVMEKWKVHTMTFIQK